MIRPLLAHTLCFSFLEGLHEVGADDGEAAEEGGRGEADGEGQEVGRPGGLPAGEVGIKNVEDEEPVDEVNSEAVLTQLAEYGVKHSREFTAH